MYKHILVPTDGTDLSLKAVKAATQLAKTLGSKITTLHVTEPWYPPLGTENTGVARMSELEEGHRQAMKESAKAAFAAAEKVTAKSGVTAGQKHVSAAQPWDAIIATANKEKCDLVVMASHGRRGLKGLLLGSETVKVLTHSKVPVLVCR